MRRQDYCRNCEENTLHELDPDPVNHVLHLLITIFCIGLWLPVWILFAVTAPRRYLRCFTCGHVLGGQTESDREADALYRAEAAARRQEAMNHAANVAASVTASAAQTTGRAVGAGISAGWAGIRLAALAIRESFKQVDRVFRRMADGDEFMVWFFWSVLGVVMLLVGTVVGAMLFQLYNRS